MIDAHACASFTSWNSLVIPRVVCFVPSKATQPLSQSFFVDFRVRSPCWHHIILRAKAGYRFLFCVLTFPRSRQLTVRDALHPSP